MYNAIDGVGFLNAMFVNDDGVRLNADDAKRSCTARKGLLVCVDTMLISIYIFVHNKGRLIKEDIYSLFVE